MNNSPDSNKSPNIYPIKVIRSVQYSPEFYLDYCKEYGEEPTQDGFLDFIKDLIDDDFSLNNAKESVEYVKQ